MTTKLSKSCHAQVAIEDKYLVSSVLVEKKKHKKEQNHQMLVLVAPHFLVYKRHNPQAYCILRITINQSNLVNRVIHIRKTDGNSQMTNVCCLFELFTHCGRLALFHWLVCSWILLVHDKLYTSHPVWSQVGVQHIQWCAAHWDEVMIGISLTPSKYHSQIINYYITEYWYLHSTNLWWSEYTQLCTLTYICCVNSSINTQLH